jgi:hypothetical protein
MLRGFLLVGALGLVALVATGCGDEGGADACGDVACLHQALSEAAPGDTVWVSDGLFEGNFTLPAGVILSGEGSDRTTLAFQGDAPVVEVLAGDGHATELGGIRVEGGAGGGLRCQGDCEIDGTRLVLSDVDVSVEGGVGLQVSGVCSVQADGVRFAGNIDETNRDGIPVEPDQARFAAVGIALVSVGQANLTQLEATGFAAFGVVLLDTPATWDGGEVYRGVGTGVQVGGPVTVTLKNLSIHDVWMGATPFGYGIVASDGAHLVTEQVIAENNDNAGLLMDNASGEHTDSRFRSNHRGVWIQTCTTPPPGKDRVVVFRGDATELSDNLGVGVGIHGSSGVTVSGGIIRGTSKMQMATQAGGEAPIGDGIDIYASGDLIFEDLAIEDNQRAGVAVDCGGADSLDITFTDVSISGGGERGFSVANGTVSSAPEVTTEALRQADLAGEPLDVAADLGAEGVPAPDAIIDIDY